MILFSQQLNLSETWVTYVRPILEYCSPVWSPHHKYLINKIESVQKFFTKRLPGLWDISYPKRLQLLNLQSLEYRRIFQDLILCYQILHGRYDTTIASCFFTALVILREVISLNCTNVIAPLMSPNTILLTELSMYGTVFQTLLSQLLACYLFVISWLKLICIVFVLISIYTLLCYHCLLCSLFCPCILSVLVAFWSIRYQ